MREVLGIWLVWRHGAYEASAENGKFVFKSVIRPYEYGRKEEMKFKRAFGERYFGDKRFLIGVEDKYVTRILRECAGKSEEEVVGICKVYKDRREERRAEAAQKWEKWQKLREKFDGVVIGIDSRIDVYGAGFSVRVLFGSDVTFEGKRKFLSENRIEFVAWVMHELAESKSAARRIGDMKFYRPVEIVNLRGHEVEVKFEVKREVA